MWDEQREAWERDADRVFAHDEVTKGSSNVTASEFRRRKMEDAMERRERMAAANSMQRAWAIRVNVTQDELLDGIPERDEGSGIADRPNDFLDAYYGDF